MCLKRFGEVGVEEVGEKRQRRSKRGKKKKKNKKGEEGREDGGKSRDTHITGVCFHIQKNKIRA